MSTGTVIAPICRFVSSLMACPGPAALYKLPSQEAGAGTGTYGLFRDLAAPFGVAVFVPLFTNQITSLIAGGVHEVNAAVRSIHSLAMAELVCIAAGMIAVFFLPKIRNKGETA